MNLLKGALLSRKMTSMYFISWIVHPNIIRCYKSSLQAEFRSTNVIHSLLNNITTLNSKSLQIIVIPPSFQMLIMVNKYAESEFCA